MRNSKLPVILALAVCALVVGVLLYFHFTHPQAEPPAPPASSAAASSQLPSPWGGGGEVVTRIG